jgi:hypothetical protein
VKVIVQLVPSPPLQGVELYSHVGGSGGGGGGDGGADGGAQWPSQSTMYSTYTLLPWYSSSTSGVAVVTNVYVLSPLGGSGTWLAHSKKPRPSYGASPVGGGLHLPCTCSPLAVVLTMYSSSSSKSVSLTVTVR